MLFSATLLALPAIAFALSPAPLLSSDALASRALATSNSTAEDLHDHALEPLEDWNTLENEDDDDLGGMGGMGLMLNQHDRVGVQGWPTTAAVTIDARGVVHVLVGAAQRLARRAGKFKGSARITWYAGGDMHNPSCFGSSRSKSDRNWTPVSSKALVVAPTFKRQWKNKPKCGEFIELKRGSKRVVVRVVDECASCKGQWFDLSTRAFKRLAPLSQGVGKGLKWRRVKGPKSWSKKTYGPKRIDE